MSRSTFPVFCLILLFSLAGSCDRTDIRNSCRIQAPDTPLRVGVPTGLTLEVPEAISAQLRRMAWSLIPTNTARIQWPTNSRGDRTSTNDRQATLTALAPGRLEISVFAFYGPQTSPQRIAVRTLDVLP